MPRTTDGSRSKSVDAGTREKARRLIHDLGNDLGALRLRVSILPGVPPEELAAHAEAAARLATHSEQLLRELRELLDDGPAARP
jgi:phosphoserine phosphatase